MYEKLKEEICLANIELKSSGLVIFSWGNVSGIDRNSNVVVIKPSGVPYCELTPEKMVVLDMDGKIVEGKLKPSSDTPTHLELYKNFNKIGGICHTHSINAAIWAQACKEIPCLGTTHADYFYGAVPVTDQMTNEEIAADYELNTGRVIVRRFKDLSPLDIPAVLVANHGPFTWGKNAAEAVENAAVLEHVAAMALGTKQINLNQQGISQTLLDKHYLRKNGNNAYYGQE